MNEGEVTPAMPMVEGTPEAGTEASMQATPQVEGRRTQLKVLRENIHYLSNDVGNFRRSHAASIKKLEKQVATLRSELAAQSVSKDLGSFRKSHDVSTKRLEKQVSTLRNELAALKANIAKDAARGHARQEATLARILAKVSKKPKASKAAKPAKQAKSAKKR